MESRERDAVTRKVVQVVDHSATDPGRRKSRKRGRAENKVCRCPAHRPVHTPSLPPLYLQKSADESRAGPVGGEDAEEGDFRRAFRDVIDFGATRIAAGRRRTTLLRDSRRHQVPRD